MEIPSIDPLTLAGWATRLGTGTIVIPDLASHYCAAAKEGYLILGKPFRCERLMELVDEACARTDAHCPPQTPAA